MEAMDESLTQHVASQASATEPEQRTIKESNSGKPLIFMICIPRASNIYHTKEG